jgi:hypothetical protein
MKYIKKISVYGTIIIVLFIFSSAADASGFICQWEPFRVDKDLFFVNQDKKLFINDSPVSDLKAAVPEDQIRETSDLSDKRDNESSQKMEKKSFLDNIKINISPTDSNTIISKYEKHSNTDDEQISKFINAMTTLIYDDKKIKSLETVGKIIEPQINFYFEF